MKTVKKVVAWIILSPLILISAVLVAPLFILVWAVTEADK